MALPGCVSVPADLAAGIEEMSFGAVLIAADYGRLVDRYVPEPERTQKLILLKAWLNLVSQVYNYTKPFLEQGPESKVTSREPTVSPAEMEPLKPTTRNPEPGTKPEGVPK